MEKPFLFATESRCLWNLRKCPVSIGVSRSFLLDPNGCFLVGQNVAIQEKVTFHRVLEARVYNKVIL